MEKGQYSNSEIRSLAGDIIVKMPEGQVWTRIKPILDQKVSFVKLDLLGEEIGKAAVGMSEIKRERLLKLCDEIIEYDAMGGYVIVGQALNWLLATDYEKVMKKTREYIIAGDVWYVCDILGERSYGMALIKYFDQSIPWMKNFLEDENLWVKRSVGVAIHFFSKRVPDESAKTKRLLKLVEPYMEVKQKDVVKGIGWGLKTIGKYHPDLLVDFMTRQFTAGKDMSKLLIRKATEKIGAQNQKKLAKYLQNAS